MLFSGESAGKYLRPQATKIPAASMRKERIKTPVEPLGGPGSEKATEPRSITAIKIEITVTSLYDRVFCADDNILIGVSSLEFLEAQ